VVVVVVVEGGYTQEDPQKRRRKKRAKEGVNSLEPWLESQPSTSLKPWLLIRLLIQREREISRIRSYGFRLVPCSFPLIFLLSQQAMVSGVPRTPRHRSLRDVPGSRGQE